VTEYKHLTGQSHSRTSLTFEYPSDTGDPYYPIPRADHQQRFKAYERLANSMRSVMFIGRLATYRYYNMDQVVGQALATFKRIEEESKVADDLAASPRSAFAEGLAQS
jgi:UDP-galactopyranose mutase